MKIKIYSFGKISRPGLQSEIDGYISRLVRNRSGIKFQFEELKDKNSDRPLEPLATLEELGLSPNKSYLLAEWGTQSDTSQVAQLLRKKMLESEDMNFIIANAHGWQNSHENRQLNYFSLSKLTLNHEHAQLILLEQLYRVCDIISGGKYHK